MLFKTISAEREGGREGKKSKRDFWASDHACTVIAMCHRQMQGCIIRRFYMCAVSLNVPDLAVKLKWLHWLVGRVAEGT